MSHSESEKHFFVLAGERSGDVHAAELCHALKGLDEKVRFSGLGGTHLCELSHEFEDWVEEAAVIGIFEVLKKYGWFKKKLNETHELIMQNAPDGVILVDYPGFNLRLVKALRKSNYQGRIYYYISPQVWAWNQGRIPKMAKILDLMLCVFPFEKELYEASGLKTEWVGHPLIDELNEKKKSTERAENLIGLFPGSRTREVNSLLPPMLEAAEVLWAEHPQWEFEIAVASKKVEEQVAVIISERKQANTEFYKGKTLTVKVGNFYDLMQQAAAGWIASGTATLEAAFFGLPHALIYKVSPVTYQIAKRLIKIDFIGIVNVLSKRLVVKEFVQHEVTVENLASEMNLLMESESYRNEMTDNLKVAVDQLGEGGAHLRAANSIYSDISKLKAAKSP